MIDIYSRCIIENKAVNDDHNVQVTLKNITMAAQGAHHNKQLNSRVTKLMQHNIT